MNHISKCVGFFIKAIRQSRLTSGKALKKDEIFFVKSCHYDNYLYGYLTELVDCDSLTITFQVAATSDFDTNFNDYFEVIS